MKDPDFTLSELEQLIAGYYACRLSRSEERTLRNLLAVTPLQSPVIDECRMVMGLENITRPVSCRHVVRNTGRLISAAASIVIVLSVGLSWFSINKNKDITQSEYIAYVNGRKISDPDEAKAIVEKDRQRCLTLMDETIESVRQQQAECTEIMNRMIKKTEFNIL